LSTNQKRSMPSIVSATEWQAALDDLRAEEKALTQASDALAAKRRRLPMVRIDKAYVFKGPAGEASLIDLFSDCRQLIVYHFMYAPGVHGWPQAGCPGCSWFVDGITHLAHLRARDTSLVLVSAGPLSALQKYRERMGWEIPWYSSEGSDFNRDFGLTTDNGEIFGLSVFLRDGEDNVYRTYFTNGRGAESLGSHWSFLDLTPYGRQETWEDSPAGWPQSPPYAWWRRHDEYE
jgi:predicted dithiol-disulfide oxidoreductase (DUF899 family)